MWLQPKTDGQREEPGFVAVPSVPEEQGGFLTCPQPRPSAPSHCRITAWSRTCRRRHPALCSLLGLSPALLSITSPVPGWCAHPHGRQPSWSAHGLSEQREARQRGAGDAHTLTFCSGQAHLLHGAHTAAGSPGCPRPHARAGNFIPNVLV